MVGWRGGSVVSGCGVVERWAEVDDDQDFVNERHIKSKCQDTAPFSLANLDDVDGLAIFEWSLLWLGTTQV